MPYISFLLPDGTQRRICGRSGISVMRAAIQNGVPGILAECGGAISCGTCHVFVDAAWYDRLPVPGDNERTLLDFTATPSGPTSRLSCQVLLADEIDGAVFRIPEHQI